MSGPAIEVNNLIVCYGETVAVAGISFDAKAGQIVALLGPNGAGKTSTVETLEGYRRPDSGTVRVLGRDPHREQRALSRRMGVMLQKGGVYPAMSPREAVRLFAHYYDASEEPEGLLYRVGLTSVATTPWRRLSGGEQQRLSLALALVGRPWVAFLDEPTAGVDPQGRLAIREVIADLRSAGTCVLLTTHEMQEAERLADRIVILDRGVIVADGSPSELMAQEGGKGIRFAAPAGLDTFALAATLAATVEEDWPGEYVVHAVAKPALIAALTAWLADRDVALTDLRTGRERLEEVFLRLTASPETTAAVPRAVARSTGAVGTSARGAPANGTWGDIASASSGPSASSTGGAAGGDTAGGARATGSVGPGAGAGTLGRRRRVRASGRGPGATEAASPSINAGDDQP